jgi:hypothetical protein
MLVVTFNPHRRRRPPKQPTPQDDLPKVDVPPPGQSIQEQLKQALLQQRIQSHYPGRHRSYRTEERSHTTGCRLSAKPEILCSIRGLPVGHSVDIECL